DGDMEPFYIIDVHIMIMRDRKFIDRTVKNIREMSVNAEWAVRMTVDQYREIFDRMEDDYLRERISDIQYAGQRILTNLVGKKRTAVDMGEGVIIIAADLSPADTAQLKIDKVLGFATDAGGKTSHTAIVARSMAIPAVLGLENITRSVLTHDDIIIDGSAGVVIVHPDPEIRKRYEGKKRLYEKDQNDLLDCARLPAVTKDHYTVEIGGNIEFIEEIPSAILHGADGIGLYRTEFIYINREQPPDEEDHLANYRSVVGVQGLSWATIRTFDLGGDKFFPDKKLSRELNPQLGLRAIRFCLKEVELFKVQLRAILRSSVQGKLRIMFPMISGIEEIREAKRIFMEVKNELLADGTELGKEIEIGIMIEVPSAVIVAEELAKEVDFFSIGTNDLIQYVLAIDRINERVTYLYEPLHPAVLRLIKQVVDVGHKAGIRVAMCGEMAGEPIYTMILLGLELDELSMNPLAIPRVKKIIRGVTLKESKALLNNVMALSSASDIRSFVGAAMHKRFPEDFPVNGS
ncbi:MAG: phosphoenolpyruvate--protein phosphotransferase, partial [Syntrophales bacterium]|nr:phosphoenolpyruvate--protein phosphotransferase [Syntrophales bacterium]